MDRLSGGANGLAGKLRIRPDLNIDYPQSDIEQINSLPADKGYEILTTFFGLYGVASPLPGFYTEELLDEEWEDRAAKRDFLDVIHQHLYPLLYKAWLKYRFSHNAVEHEGDGYWEIIYSLLGLPAEFREKGGKSSAVIKYAGIINQRPKTQAGLQTILQDYLAPVKVVIEPCVHRKVRIPRHQRSVVSEVNNTLGTDCLIGEQVDDRGGKYNICIGPLNSEQFQNILNSAERFAFVRSICQLFLVQPLQNDIVLKLEKGAVKPICLGQSAYSSLGQTTWLANAENDYQFSMVLN